MLRACSLILCLSFALAAPTTAFADAAARVLSVTQGVRYSLGNTGEALAVKMDVPVKAVVMSDATGKAQLMFPDDSTLSIAPDTQISLAEYVDAEREENIVLDLVSGTARIITGESNRKNPQAFTVNTPQASIGIRGTLVTIQAGGGVTRVYLSETSGQGVSVRNLGTGQVMELRKPGTIINVGANFMEERKAQKEEAASFSAALRGKSRAEIARATARAQGEIRRAVAASLAPEGALPPAGAADPVQLAALTVDDRLDHASLVADITPAPVLPPATAPAVPEVPSVPDTPDVPPIAPETPLPGPDVDKYVITDFSQVANATFTGSGIYNLYENGSFTRSADSTHSDLDFPSNFSSLKGNIFTFNIDASHFFVPYNYSLPSGNYSYASYPIGNVEMELNMDGIFKIDKKEIVDNRSYDLHLNGKIESPESGTITSITLTVNGDGRDRFTELSGVMHISRTKQ